MSSTMIVALVAGLVVSLITFFRVHFYNKAARLADQMDTQELTDEERAMFETLLHYLGSSTVGVSMFASAFQAFGEDDERLVLEAEKFRKDFPHFQRAAEWREFWRAYWTAGLWANVFFGLLYISLHMAYGPYRRFMWQIKRLTQKIPPTKEVLNAAWNYNLCHRY